MKLVPIQQVGGHIKAAATLPFGVRDAEGVLVLGALIAIFKLLEAWRAEDALTGLELEHERNA